jgi:hypothetical protein
MESGIYPIVVAGPNIEKAFVDAVASIKMPDATNLAKTTGNSSIKEILNEAGTFDYKGNIQEIIEKGLQIDYKA